ncbi:MAG: hypothetical protein VXZ53_11420, partial [Planctomycetota bacterium]|nr:hypothetical protein [Planctomycetota bacterium]
VGTRISKPRTIYYSIHEDDPARSSPGFADAVLTGNLIFAEEFCIDSVAEFPLHNSPCHRPKEVSTMGETTILKSRKELIDEC